VHVSPIFGDMLCAFQCTPGTPNTSSTTCVRCQNDVRHCATQVPLRAPMLSTCVHTLRRRILRIPVHSWHSPYVVDDVCTVLERRVTPGNTCAPYTPHVECICTHSSETCCGHSNTLQALTIRRGRRVYGIGTTCNTGQHMCLPGHSCCAHISTLFGDVLCAFPCTPGTPNTSGTTCVQCRNDVQHCATHVPPRAPMLGACVHTLRRRVACVPLHSLHSQYVGDDVCTVPERCATLYNICAPQGTHVECMCPQSLETSCVHSSTLLGLQIRRGRHVYGVRTTHDTVEYMCTPDHLC